MKRLMPIVSAAIIVGGFGFSTSAQAGSVEGAAALRGLQNRSIRISAPTVQPPLRNPYEKSTIGVSGSSDDQVTYRQLNDDTNLVVSPVKGDRELLDNANAGDTGNNRIQVLYQPVQ